MVQQLLNLTSGVEPDHKHKGEIIQQTKPLSPLTRVKYVLTDTDALPSQSHLSVVHPLCT